MKIKRLFVILFSFSVYSLFSQDYMRLKKKQLRIEHQKKLNLIDSLTSINQSLYDKNLNLEKLLNTSTKANEARLLDIEALSEEIRDKENQIDELYIFRDSIAALSNSILVLRQKLTKQLSVYREQNIQTLNVKDWVGGYLQKDECNGWGAFYFDKREGKYFFEDQDYGLISYEIISMEFDNYSNIIILNLAEEFIPGYDTLCAECEEPEEEEVFVLDKKDRIIKIKVDNERYYFIDYFDDTEMSQGYYLCFK